MRTDEARLADFLDAAETVNLDEVGRWNGLLEPLGRLLQGEPVAYGVSSASGVCRMAFMAHPRAVMAEQVAARMDARLRAQGSWGFYRVAEVVESQRNRPVVLSQLTEDTRQCLREAGLHRYGLGEADQLRVIICDGGTMRCWFGAFRGDDDPFTRREVGLLARAVPALKRRLDLETQWTQGRLALTALEVGLEAFGRPALIADGRGAVEHPNHLARALHDEDPVGFAASLEGARRGLTAEWSGHPLIASGLGTHTLWVHAGPVAAVTLPAIWPLSPREREVLGLVARGLTNAAIAGQLACSERTVEAHVARLLVVAQCETRAELVARVWRTPT